MHYIDTNWAGPDGKHARLMMRAVPHYGAGNTAADSWAQRIVRSFSELVESQPTPGFMLTPGLFLLASAVSPRRNFGATPDGRSAGDPIAQGANPSPGHSHKGTTPTLRITISLVQPGLGHTTPVQIELDPSVTHEEASIDKVVGLIRNHFETSRTQIQL